MRNLCDECDKCEDRYKSLSYCFDVCSAGIDILETIEKMRINSDLLNIDQAAGYFTAVREICNIVNDSEYPEYLEENILEWLESKGVKL